MLNLIRKYPQLLLFGILTAMFSGPGQSFLISFFIPHMQEAFSLTRTGIMALYGLATLFSALLLPFIGKLLDRIQLRRFTLAAGLLLALGCFVLSASVNIWMVLVGFLLIRNLGQGTLSMVSSTTMAKLFGRGRGKALGIANIGYPLSEAIFPFLVTAWIAHYGWRSGWSFLAVLVLFFFSPAIFLLVKPEAKSIPIEDDPALREVSETLEKEISDVVHPVTHWKVRDVIRDVRFYVLAFHVFLTPAFLTALFLNHDQVILWKGWTEAMMAAAFVAFALTRGVVSFAIGPVVDKISAKRIFPFILIPFAIGLAGLLIGKNPLWTFFYLGGAGLTLGFGRTVSGALWAELYGTAHLGAIRGLLSSIIVFSTAISPVAMGFLLDHGTSLSTLLIWMMALLAIAMSLSCWILRTGQK